MIILWSSYDHLTIILLSSYDHLMIILRSSYDHLTIILRSSYDHLTIILQSCYDHLTIILWSSSQKLHYKYLFKKFVNPTLFLFHPAKNKQLSTLKNFYAELLMLRQSKLERLSLQQNYFSCQCYTNMKLLASDKRSSLFIHRWGEKTKKNL